MNISELFFIYIVKNQSLKIDGFGQFDAEFSESYLHPINNEFSPSNLKLNFRLDKNTQDDGLIAFLAEKLNVTENQVVQLLKEEKEQWIRKLKSGGEVVFNHIGKLKVVSTGAVVFQQVDDFSLSIDDFGLKPFTSSPIREKEVVAEDKMIRPAAPEKAKGKLVVWLSAAIVVIAAGLGYWFFGDMLFKSSTTETSVVADSLIEKSVIQDSTQSVDDFVSVITDTIQTDSVEISTPTEPITTATDNASTNTPSGSYLVVAGCFREQAKADEYVVKLKGKGYEASIRGKTSSGLLRVCVGVFSSSSEASNYSAEFNSKEGSASWIQRYDN